MQKRLRTYSFIALIGSLVLLAGCELLSPPPQPKPRTDTVENDFVEFSRTVLTPLKTSQEFTVQVKITAKVDLKVALLSESLPAGLQLAEDSQLKAAQLGLAAGATLEHSYTVKAGAKAGSFTITGNAIVATSQGTQDPLALESAIQVK